MFCVFDQVDGSVAMWDLRETSSIHKATEVEDQEYSLRYPTYDTGKYIGQPMKFSYFCIYINSCFEHAFLNFGMSLFLLPYIMDKNSKDSDQNLLCWPIY